MNDRDVKKYPYLQKSVDTTDWKLETSFHGTRRRFTFVSFFGGHGTLGPFAGESLPESPLAPLPDMFCDYGTRVGNKFCLRRGEPPP